MAEWTYGQQVAALSEGWDVWHCDFRDNGALRFEIQALMESFDDFPLRFDNDDDAWRHVLTMAREGSALHQAAVAFIKEHDPIEYALFVHD